ncbi:TPA: hypothetical protein SMT47_001153 [Proteus mirabilis]|nr:hypothetical protein [Proteus mirabilis]HEK3134978.1 hypothetical protein [Proteus mirabilis]
MATPEDVELKIRIAEIAAEMTQKHIDSNSELYKSSISGRGDVAKTFERLYDSIAGKIGINKKS